MPARSDVFGPRKPYYKNGVQVTGGQHNGDDFTGLGTVRAIGPGTVVVAGRVAGWGAAGIEVVIDHGGGIFSRSWHLAATLVSEGDEVDGGTPIGREGSTGVTFGRHLHLQVHRGSWKTNATAISPSEFILTMIQTPAGTWEAPFEEDDMTDEDRRLARARHEEAMWELACLRPIKLYALVDEAGAGGWLWVGPSGKWWATGQDMGAYVVLADAQKLSQPRPIRAMQQAEFDYMTKQFLPMLAGGEPSDAEREMEQLMQLDPATVSQIVEGLGNRPAVLTEAQLAEIAEAAARGAQAGGAQGAREEIKSITLVVQ
ncbi:M23 family metallopeptidase [Microbacterium sp. NPDC078428]|uniref:M23 family metallopeptidase n=1 Tax=Microbacterium sp. NPDC078428 TaxID=3364190 RepID=UPI0037CB189B